MKVKGVSMSPNYIFLNFRNFRVSINSPRVLLTSEYLQKQDCRARELH